MISVENERCAVNTLIKEIKKERLIVHFCFKDHKILKSFSFYLSPNPIVSFNQHIYFYFIENQKKEINKNINNK